MGLSTTYTKTETDFLIQQLEKKSEALYTDDTLAGDIIKRVDKNTGENVNYRETTTWYDGSAMDDSKVDGNIFRKIGAKYYERKIEGGIFTPEMFGAKGDGVTDDTLALQKCLDFCTNPAVLGDKKMVNLATINLNSKYGYKITNTLTSNGSVNFICNTNIFWKGTKDKKAIYFSHIKSATIKIKLVADTPSDISNDNFTGIHFNNCRNSTIRIEEVTGFTNGVIFEASNGDGFAWNEIFINRIFGCRNFLTLMNNTGGWCNANQFHGGSFTDSMYGTVKSSNVADRNYILITGDGSYNSNSNVFYGTCFEGGSSLSKYNGFKTYVIKDDLGAKFVRFIGTRIENVNIDHIGIIQQSSDIIFLDDLYVENYKMKLADGNNQNLSLKYTKLISFDLWDKVKTLQFPHNKGIDMIDTNSKTFRIALGYAMRFGRMFQILEPVHVKIRTGARLSIYLFDENKALLSTELINSQINLFTKPSDFTNSSNAINFVVNPKREVECLFRIIPEAKFIFIGVGSDTPYQVEFLVEDGKIDKVIPTWEFPYLKENQDRYLVNKTPNLINSGNGFLKGEKYINITNGEKYTITGESPMTYVID